MKSRTLIIALLCILMYSLSATSITACGEARKGGSDDVNVDRDMSYLSNWCYIDRSGDIAINLESRFDFACCFSEGLAAVSDDSGLYGYIDKLGNVVIEPQFRLAGEFHEGLAAVDLNVIGCRQAYINTKGEIVLDGYGAAGPFSEGLAPVWISGKCGFIDTSGRFVIEPQYDWANSFSGGLASVSKDGKCAFIDREGTVLLESDYIEAMPFQEGLSCVGSLYDEGRILYGFIDLTGTTVIEPSYEYAQGFSEGLAVAASAGRWGYIDKSGVMVIEPQYGYDASFPGHVSFSEGLAAVPGGFLWGYIDRNGDWAIEPSFVEAYRFSEGLAPVILDKD